MVISHRIIITGGHLTPALATIELLAEKGWQIWYVGRKHAQEEDSSISIEYQIMKEFSPKVNLLLITTGKLQRYLNLKFFLSLIKIPIGFIQSLSWIIKIRPHVVLSFGGYVALPVAIAAYCLKIPVVTHEQTHAPGLANKIISKFAKKICLTWEDSQEFFNKRKTEVVGLPLRRSVFEVKKGFLLNLDKPLLYISGGSLGSHKINLLFEPIIGKLLTNFSIIHQCGQTIKYNDYARFMSWQQTLLKNLQRDYLPVSYIKGEEIGWVYKHVSLVIGRSGANTVYELATLGIPTIFIPLSFASANEQGENALLFQNNHAGKILNEKSLTSDKLFEEIMFMYKHLSEYRKKALVLSAKINFNGAQNLVSALEKTVNW